MSNHVLVTLLMVILRRGLSAMAGIRLPHFEKLLLAIKPRLHGCGMLILLAIFGCSSVTSEDEIAAIQASDKSADSFLIVDCLLPGQVRKLGGQFSFLTARRPIKTSSSNCEIRGGEYVSYDRADYSTALKIWLPMAQEGDAEAQSYVGEIYEKGLGLIPDFAVAAHWYQKAADQELARAQINLGHLYEKGLGVNKNIVTAMKYYRLASGLTSDQLTYASSLQASYVPREDFQTVNQQLLQSEIKLQQSQQQAALLRQRIAKQQTQMAGKNKKLYENEQNLQAMQMQLQALLLNPPSAAGLSGKREQQLLDEIQSLEQQRVTLLGQITSLQGDTQAMAQEKAQLKSQVQQSSKAEASSQQQLSLSQAELDQTALQLQQQGDEITELQQSMRKQQASQGVSTTSNQLAVAELEQSIEKKNAKMAQLQQQYDALLQKNQQEQKQLSALSNQLHSQEQQLEQKLASSRQQKKQQQQAISLKERELVSILDQLQHNEQQLQQSLAQTQRELDSATTEHQQVIGGYESQLASLALQMQVQEQLVGKQKQQIVVLQDDIDSYNGKLIEMAAFETVAMIIDDSPSIEIIDPPVILTRSTPTVKLRSQQEFRDIIGKVSAPAGLLSLPINGVNQELQAQSLFKKSIAINKEVTPVEVVVVDNKGRRVAISFTLLQELLDNSPVKPAASVSSIDTPLGNYYALIIGNNDYQSMSTLLTPVNDATEAAKILKNQYQFNTRLLLNATRYQILSALNKLRAELEEDDNLLIYYAGHGKLDSINKRGYWLPVDADESNSANWISNTAITDILNAMKAKHVLVVADSCYSGSLSQTAIARIDQELEQDVKKEWIKVMANTRARLMLTSGGIQPVLDGGGGEHSIFAKAFLDTLRENGSILEGYSLYYEVLTRVMGKASKLDSEQVPQYGPIHLAGHESGEFLFAPKI